MNYTDFVFGGIGYQIYLAAGTMLLLGLIFMWLYRIRKSIRTNPDTPERFSLKYLLKTSLFQITISVLMGIIGAFLMLRLTNELFGVELSAGVSVALGLCFDWAIDKLAGWKNKLPV